jgi:hypothetical protein
VREKERRDCERKEIEMNDNSIEQRLSASA